MTPVGTILGGAERLGELSDQIPIAKIVSITTSSTGHQGGPATVIKLGIRKQTAPTIKRVRFGRLRQKAPAGATDPDRAGSSARRRAWSGLTPEERVKAERKVRQPISSIGTVMAAISYFMMRG